MTMTASQSMTDWMTALLQHGPVPVASDRVMHASLCLQFSFPPHYLKIINDFSF